MINDMIDYYHITIMNGSVLPLNNKSSLMKKSLVVHFLIGDKSTQVLFTHIWPLKKEPSPG